MNAKIEGDSKQQTLTATIEADNSNYILINRENQIGDTNLDGNININDVTAIQRHLADIELLTDEQIALADTNGDGNVDITDATHRVLVGKKKEITSEYIKLFLKGGRKWKKNIKKEI